MKNSGNLIHSDIVKLVIIRENVGFSGKSKSKGKCICIARFL